MPNKKSNTAAPLLTAAHLRCFTKLADEELERREAKRQKQRNRRKERQSERAKAEDEIIGASRLEEEDLKQLRRSTPEALRLIEQVGSPWPYQTLTADFETKTSALSGQAMRFGYFQLRGLPYENNTEGDETILGHALKGDLTRAMLDRLRDHGLVYDPDHLKDSEISKVKQFVARYNELGLHQAGNLCVRQRFCEKRKGRNHVVGYVRRGSRFQRQVPKCELAIYSRRR